MPPSMSATEHQHSTSLYHSQTDNSQTPKASQSSAQRGISAVGTAHSTNQTPGLIDASSAGSANFTTTVSDPNSRRPPVSLHRRSTSINDIRDGVGNLDRWSQSTTSSRGSSAHHHQPSNSFSRRMSFGGSGLFGTASHATPQSPTRPQNPPTNPFESATPRGPSTRHRRSISAALPGLPPIITIPPAQKSEDRSSFPDSATNQTPSTAALISAAAHQTHSASDYFGRVSDSQSTGLSPRSSDRFARRPSAGSIRTSPAAQSAHSATSPGLRPTTEATGSKERGHSRNRSPGGKGSGGTDISSKSKERSPKPSSSKAMLSKALQKANTAVLLDNAQNFEGAVQAYSEACTLLTQVMMRSSGNDDKRKLEAIVSIVWCIFMLLG